MGNTAAEIGQRTKVCRRCEEVKPADAFNRSSQTEDGLQSWCRECYKLYKRGKPARKVEMEKALASAEAALAEVRHIGRNSAKEAEVENELAVRVWQLRLEQGLTRGQIAEGIGTTIKRVDQLLARAKKIAFNSDSREELRMWALLQYEEHMYAAREAGNLAEARLAIGDMLKAAGLVSTGGNTLNVGMQVNAGSKFEERIEQLLLAEKEIVDGEVVEDSPASGSSSASVSEEQPPTVDPPQP